MPLSAPNPGLIERAEPVYSVADLALAEWLGVSGSTLAGVSVNERSSLGLSAVWRSVSLIAGTVAALPLKSYKRGDDSRTRVPTFLDNSPHGDFTSFEFVETVCVHLLLWGNSYLLHQYGAAGNVVGLQPLFPGSVSVEAADVPGGKLFKVNTADGTIREFTSADLLHIPGLGYDGLKGLSPIAMLRQSLGTAKAGDEAAARMYGNGFLLGGVLTPTEEITTEQADQVRAGLKAKSQGVRNAGDVAFVPANLKFAPWSMSAEDAQFLESRKFGVTEVARIFGLPVHLLSAEGVSTWGAGIKEMNLGLSRYTFQPYTSRIEQRLSRVLTRGHFAEFDYSGLLQGSPADEIELLIRQVNAGLVTRDEARKVRNLPALTPAQKEQVAEQVAPYSKDRPGGPQEAPGRPKLEEVA